MRGRGRDGRRRRRGGGGGKGDASLRRKQRGVGAESFNVHERRKNKEHHAASNRAGQSQHEFHCKTARTFE